MSNREEAMVRELKFVGTEDDLLLLVDPQGEQFAVPVTPELRQAIRVRRTLPSAGPRNPLPAPREVQQLLRSGLTSEQVADHFGVEVEYIAKFEAPVVAELEHMVELAQDVPLHFNEEGAETSTFGHIITHRLVNRGAVHTMWSSWREDDGRWTVQVAYSSDGSDHSARWFFDPRRRQLTPANEEADQLSSAQDLQPVKPVRLRLVDAATTVDTFPLESSEESADPQPETPEPEAVVPEPPRATASRLWERTVHPRHGGISDRPLGGVTPAEHNDRAERGERPKVHSETEDLLQALRRRHDSEVRSEVRSEGQSERPHRTETTSSPSLQSGQPRLHVVPERTEPPVEQTQTPQPSPTPAATPDADRGGLRKGRPSLPSWDEIVFGTKPHDEN